MNIKIGTLRYTCNENEHTFYGAINLKKER